LLFLAFVVEFLLYLGLRLPRTLVGVIAPVLAVIPLCVLAAWDAAYAGKSGPAKPSQWWLALFLPAALLAGMVHSNWQLRASGFGVYSLASRSMAPTLPLNSRLMVDRWHYLHVSPQRGDLIVFLLPTDNSVLIIKRVIALGGETIEVQGDTVLVDGKPISEPYLMLEGPVPDSVGRFNQVTLPAGTVFVMGDNRHESFDSRFFGPVDMRSIRGKVIYTIPSFTTNGRTFQ
jgi:signal peptidase I